MDRHYINGLARNLLRELGYYGAAGHALKKMRELSMAGENESAGMWADVLNAVELIEDGDTGAANDK